MTVRQVQPRYAAPVPMDNPALASKLVAYTAPGFEPQARALLSDPALSAMLGHLPYVDAAIEATRVVFNDPYQEAFTAIVGPVAQAYTPQGIEKVVWLHQTLGGVLQRLAELSR